MTPISEKAHDCCIWIKNYYTLEGDSAPNSETNSIAISFKKDLYTAYYNEQRELDLPYVHETHFLQLWRSLFPHNKTRPWLNIPGKCWICADIDALRRENSDSSVREALRQAHLLHRGGMIMPERTRYLLYFLWHKTNILIIIYYTSYHARKALSRRNKRTIFSCIVDGMDQSHSKIPYLGTQDQFKKPLNQHIQGVLTHDRGIIYLNYNNMNYY